MNNYLETASMVPRDQLQPYALIGETVGAPPILELKAEDLVPLLRGNGWEIAQDLQFLEIRIHDMHFAMQKFYNEKSKIDEILNVDMKDSDIGRIRLDKDQMKKIEPRVSLFNRYIANIVDASEANKALSVECNDKLSKYLQEYFSDRSFPTFRPDVRRDMRRI